MKDIAEFFSYLQNLDVQLWVEGDDEAVPEQTWLRCTAPEGTLTAELRQELRDRKAELIAFLQRSQSAPAATAILPAAGTVFPLSFAQQRLWFLYQLTPDNPFYNIPTAIRLTGTLNQAALERSFQEIVRRHSALRTTFTTIDGQPVQVVATDANLELAVVNLQYISGDDSSTEVQHDSSAKMRRERIVQQLATAEAQRPFNLTTDSLVRVTLLQFAPTESVLLLTLHHIVADGWSLGVLIRELACFYTTLVTGQPSELPALPIQYTDFACWQRTWLQGEILEQQLAYWKSQLQNLTVLQLPSDRPHPAVQTYRGATHPIQLSPALTQALAELSQQSGGSLFMTLLAAFQTLLHRYTEQTDITIGSPIANRHRSELEGMIGFFVNSLVLRSNLSGNPTFRELLEQVREVCLEAYRHQDLPFEKLVEELDPERDLSQNPLFQVAFALQNAPMQSLELPGLTLEPAPLETSSTRFDLEVHLWEPTHGLRSLWQSQEGLSGFISYSTDLFDRDRISRLVEHFQTLLEGVAANPESRLSDLPLLTSAEYQQLEKWNQTETLGRDDRCFHQIFEAQVRVDPEAIAVVAEQGSLTYAELNQQADQLAQILLRLGVQPDSLVGLCVDRSLEMVIGVLGILKAGAAYVPLDPKYPRDRLQFMLTDTQVPILLTQSGLTGTLPKSPAKILCLDQLDSSEYAASWHPAGRQEPGEITAGNLAYVIYTSGSTGTPKGVLLSHRGLCNAVAAQQTFQPSRQSRVLQFSSLNFDASIFEIVLALGYGGRLYIPPQSAQLPEMVLMQFLQDHAITHALLTPAVLAVLPFADLPALQVLITGGEACSSQVIDRWAVNRRFFNAYGPTEATIWTTVAQLQPGDHPLTIGRPIANAQVYILDPALNPLPAGIPGELYVAGAGLARGYLNRPDLTTECFISSPFSPSTLYKTGDRACYRPDGTIEFLGRIDTQIKIRGFRVELGEIEATLHRHPAIQDAVVSASTSLDDLRLTAYFSLNYLYLQSALTHLQDQQIQHWQALYNQTYQTRDNSSLNSHLTSQTSISKNQSFDITGWNSSYTGKPIPLEQMQEWVNDRVQQILALKPQRVLEIGCGTGLLLFQIAPHCQKYMGTDFSTVSLDSIQPQLANLNLPQVKLLHRMATDFASIEATAYDVVILNSIVQYFPSVDYLMQVLDRAIQAVAPGGVLFVGDVRNLSLLTAFHTWMKFSQAAAGVERSQLRQQVECSRFEEPELAIDPAFFHALQQRFPQIRQVQIRLTRGGHENEMTQFRYNVLLYVENPKAGQNPPPLSPSTQHHNWRLHPVTVEEIQEQLQKHKPEKLIISNVANSRVCAAIKVAEWLFNEVSPTTVGRMQEVLQTSTERAIDPQAWGNLETGLPYTVELTWSAQSRTGDYDVILLFQGVPQSVETWGDRAIFEPSIGHDRPGWNHYANIPLQAQFARQLIPELRRHLGQSLPDYMVPSTFVPLEALPLTPNGKVDRVRVAQAHVALSPSEPNLMAISPQTPTELSLMAIWKELLRLPQVNLHDNFFELGGHSLLATQMTSRVRDAFGLELPLRSVFEFPTIAQLAPIIEALGQATTTQSPPLVRLDRAAHRRLRSSLSSPIPQNPSALPPSNFIAPPNHLSNHAWSPLVPLTLGSSSNQPFFCVHPLFGVVFPYLELAQLLGNDRSFYGLQPLGLDGSHPPLDRIEVIAAYYIQAIQTLQPQGPYLLGGWSFGGLVAFEMAQQLLQAGQQIKLLAMLDTPAPPSHRPIRQSLSFLGTALWSALPFLLDYGAIVTHRFQPWKTRILRWQWLAIARLIPEESQLRLLDESAIAPLLRIVYANSQAAYRYTPHPYPDRITLFKAAEQPSSFQHNAVLGWDALAEEIQLHQVPGNHLSLLKQPHVHALAKQLRHCLF